MYAPADWEASQLHKASVNYPLGVDQSLLVGVGSFIVRQDMRETREGSRDHMSSSRADLYNMGSICGHDQFYICRGAIDNNPILYVRVCVSVYEIAYVVQ